MLSVACLPLCDHPMDVLCGLVFSTGSSHAPGNMGLHDIRLAVRWMKANGQSFGGNPNSMTIAGQGEGGSLAHAMVGIRDRLRYG